MANSNVTFTEALAWLETVFAHSSDPLNEVRGGAYWTTEEKLLLLAAASWKNRAGNDLELALLHGRSQEAIRMQLQKFKDQKVPLLNSDINWEDLYTLRCALVLPRLLPALSWVDGEPMPAGLLDRTGGETQPIRVVLASTPDGVDEEVADLLSGPAAQVDLAACLVNAQTGQIVLTLDDVAWLKNFRKGVRRVAGVERLRPSLFRRPDQITGSGTVFVAGPIPPHETLIATLPPSTLMITVMRPSQFTRAWREAAERHRIVEVIETSGLNASRQGTALTWNDIQHMPSRGIVTVPSTDYAMRFAVTFARSHQVWPDWRDCPILQEAEQAARNHQVDSGSAVTVITARVLRDAPGLKWSQRAALKLKVDADRESLANRASIPPPASPLAELLDTF